MLELHTCGAIPMLAGVRPGRSGSLYPPSEAICSNNSRFCCNNCCVRA